MDTINLFSEGCSVTPYHNRYNLLSNLLILHVLTLKTGSVRFQFICLNAIRVAFHAILTKCRSMIVIIVRI
jgi:hypothetical protein